MVQVLYGSFFTFSVLVLVAVLVNTKWPYCKRYLYCECCPLIVLLLQVPLLLQVLSTSAWPKKSPSYSNISIFKFPFYSRIRIFNAYFKWKIVALGTTTATLCFQTFHLLWLQLFPTKKTLNRWSKQILEHFEVVL